VRAGHLFVHAQLPVLARSGRTASVPACPLLRDERTCLAKSPSVAVREAAECRRIVSGILIDNDQTNAARKE
jgi:hypothetical protein